MAAEWCQKRETKRLVSLFPETFSSIHCLEVRAIYCLEVRVYVRACVRACVISVCVCVCVCV